MANIDDHQIESLAKSCVANMGDIFWDFNPVRDAEGDYTDPEKLAHESVKETLRKLARQIDEANNHISSLRAEYQAILAEVGEKASDNAIIAALIVDGEWTRKGAGAVFALARKYGSFVLRNALALADAMEIEDGEAGI